MGDEPLRVLHVIPAVAPRYGGPSTAIWPMTSALAERGVRVEVATTAADGPRRLGLRDLPDDRVPTHLLTDAAELTRWLGRHAGGYDLLHVHSLWNRAAGAGCRAARRAGVPYVVRPCGMLSRYTWGRSPVKKRLYWRLVERRNVLGAAALHATSGVERADALACGVTVPVAVIPLGVEAAALETPPRPNWLRDRCGPECGGKPIVLFLSRLHPKKGVVDFLLPAFARLRVDAHLAVAGGVDDSTPGYGVAVRQAAKALGVERRVTLVGPVAPADRWAAFDGAAVFCLPSRSENFGIVVAEAMARGCPVVAAEGVDAAEHVVAAGAGRRVRLDAASLAAAIDDLLTAPADAGRRGAEYVRERLRWPATARHVADLYQAVRSQRPFGV